MTNFKEVLKLNPLTVTQANLVLKQEVPNLQIWVSTCGSRTCLVDTVNNRFVAWMPSDTRAIKYWLERVMEAPTTLNTICDHKKCNVTQGYITHQDYKYVPPSENIIDSTTKVADMSIEQLTALIVEIVNKTK